MSNWVDRLDEKIDLDILIGLAGYVFLLAAAGVAVWVIVR